MGGWTHSDDASQDGETTFNLQTHSFFIDMRIPKDGTALLGHHQGFGTMTVRMGGRVWRAGGAVYSHVAPGGRVRHVLMVLSLRERKREENDVTVVIIFRGDCPMNVAAVATSLWRGLPVR